MADVFLFQIRGRPVFSLGKLYRTGLLSLFFAFMLFGNFSRLIPISLFPSSISLLEVALYGWALPVYFLKPRKSHLVVLVAVLSTIYGALINEFDLTSSLYALKLIGMIGAGTIVGESFADEDRLSEYLLRVFSWVLGVGFLIFFVFPKAGLFFLFLDSLGIHFHGDPHMRRFISPFFDPNYYGAIACIPLILAWQNRRYGLVALVLLSIILTFSRSGIATCGCVVLLLLLFGRGRFSWWAFGGLAILLLPLIFSQELWHLIERTVYMGEDPSALARLGTFEAAFSIFGEHPFFGTGYHYLSREFEMLTGRLSPDSSVLITLVDFGLIPTLGILIAGVWWSLSHVRRQGVIFLFHIYVAICILLTSLFNNLLYYPYWLMPVIAMLTRMGGERDATSSTCPRLADPDGGRREGS